MLWCGLYVPGSVGLEFRSSPLIVWLVTLPLDWECVQIVCNLASVSDMSLSKYILSYNTYHLEIKSRNIWHWLSLHLPWQRVHPLENCHLCQCSPWILDAGCINRLWLSENDRISLNSESDSCSWLRTMKLKSSTKWTTPVHCVCQRIYCKIYSYCFFKPWSGWNSDWLQGVFYYFIY